MKLSRPVAVVVFWAATLVGLPACGTSSDTVKPATWADRVCTSTKTWITSLRNSQPSKDELGNEPKQAKGALVKYLDKARQITATYVGKVGDAGAPDVPDGDTISKEFKKTLDQVKVAFDAAGAKARTLPENDRQKFVTQTRQISDALSKQSTKVGDSFNGFIKKHKKGGDELKKVFKQRRACSGVTA